MAMSCRDGFGSINWPDGRGLLEQPMKLIQAFDIAYESANRWQKKAGAK